MFTTQLSFGGFSPVSFCSVCGRVLTNQNSVNLGIGPVCRGKHSKSSGEKESNMDNDIARRDEFFDEEDFSVSFLEGLFLRREFQDEDKVGGIYTNIPHLVVHHSLSGFEWGYGGSGPADLALNICQLYLNITGYTGKKTKCYDGNCFTLAYLLHQDFKRNFIENSPREGCLIPFGKIIEWFDLHATNQLKLQCVAFSEEE